MIKALANPRWEHPLLSICWACTPSTLQDLAGLHVSASCHDPGAQQSSLTEDGQQGPPTAAAHPPLPSRGNRVTKNVLRRLPWSSVTASPFLSQIAAAGQPADLTQPLRATDSQVLQQHAVLGGAHHKLTDSTADLITLLRRHNNSMPGLVGQVVLAQVLHMTKDRVYVDAGFHSLSELYRPELAVTHIHTPNPSLPLATRLGTSDIRVGDVLKVSVEALYTPYGDMQLQPSQQDTSLQLSARWAALQEKADAGEAVLGRVLNQCRGGYAVGVAGFVALLPYTQASSTTCQRVGTLESFFIDRMDRKRQTMVLKDARLVEMKRAQRRRGY